jgi:DNA polymerase
VKSKIELMQEIAKNVSICQKCRLYKTAKNSVVGEGSFDTPIVFVGEAPGATEDETGRPFVGRAGKLLEVMLNKIGYTREEVWIGNVIKHRPPENRDPLPDEISSCEGYLEMQLKIINPKLVITLGRFAMNYFYSDGKISRDRGNIIKTNKYNVFPIYHPAAALRNPTMMRDFQLDFLKIPEVLKKIDNNNLMNLRETRNVRDNLKEPASEVDENQLGLGF